MIIHNGLCAVNGKEARTDDECRVWLKAHPHSPVKRYYACGNHFHLTHEKHEMGRGTPRNRRHRKHI